MRRGVDQALDMMASTEREDGGDHFVLGQGTRCKMHRFPLRDGHRALLPDQENVGHGRLGQVEQIVRDFHEEDAPSASVSNSSAATPSAFGATHDGTGSRGRRPTYGVRHDPPRTDTSARKRPSDSAKNEIQA
jgi:hypothetical protein